MNSSDQQLTHRKVQNSGGKKLIISTAGRKKEFNMLCDARGATNNSLAYTPQHKSSGFLFFVSFPP